MKIFHHLRQPPWQMKLLHFALLLLVASGCVVNQTKTHEASVQVGGARIWLDIEPNVAASRADVIEWVRRAAVAVTNCLGRFPVNGVVIRIHGGGYDAIADGVAHGASSIDVRLGPGVGEKDFDGDWILTHEMFHLGFPTLDPRYLWMMEGLSDYLEPIARGRAGQLTQRQVWREFVEGLPQGLPQAGDDGLDGSQSRERIYWGGNIYWLLADVRIRAQTNNRRSVDDAIRAILAEGGNGGVVWPLNRVLKVGETATGTTVLKDLYEELGPQRGNVDLDALWKQLGIHYDFGRITFNDHAPLARVRDAITAPPVAVLRTPGS
ncbi:MAG TPA: hypothetical protein VL970_05220 [Candidatus Acidoferrales bacterium]|nr:hypothetical protein [Candidatus Acidoferrales bacterium]